MGCGTSKLGSEVSMVEYQSPPRSPQHEASNNRPQVPVAPASLQGISSRAHSRTAEHIGKTEQESPDDARFRARVRDSAKKVFVGEGRPQWASATSSEQDLMAAAGYYHLMLGEPDPWTIIRNTKTMNAETARSAFPGTVAFTFDQPERVKTDTDAEVPPKA